MAIILRPYQERAIAGVRASFRSGHRAPLLVSPTGSGKTVMLSRVCADAIAKGTAVDILAHRGELLEQIGLTLARFGIPHGFISPGYTPDPFAAVQVASVQTLVRRMHRGHRRPGLVIFDEAHHVLQGNQWGRVYQGLGRPAVLGLTATPCRGDGKGLGVDVGGVFDDMIEVASVAELVAGGHLVKPVVFAPQSASMDLSGVGTRAGDYDRGELAKRMNKPAITGDAVGHYARLCGGVPAIAFGVDLAHCREIAAEFRAAGFNFQPIDGTMDATTRKALIHGLGRGIDGLVSADLIGEGVDVPAVGAVILLRPTKSLGLFMQQVGRGLRPCEGKDRAIVLDHVGNCLIHGLPTDERDWSLEGVQKGKGKAKADPTVRVQTCPKCYLTQSPAATCERCGHEYDLAPRRDLERQAGDLVEITPEMAAQRKREQKREIGACRSLEELRALAVRRGYARGWADHIWRARQSKAAARSGGI